MRTEPAAKLNKKEAAPFHIKVERITRIVAIIVAFLSTFTFFLKILFF
jgi:hypothetical protein